MIPEVCVYKIHDEARLPIKSPCKDQAFDVFGCITDSLEGVDSYNEPFRSRLLTDSNGPYVELPPGGRLIIPTGLQFELPEGFDLNYHTKSGIGHKLGIIVTPLNQAHRDTTTNEVSVQIANLLKIKVKLYHHVTLCQVELIKASPFHLIESLKPNHSSQLCVQNG